MTLNLRIIKSLKIVGIACAILLIMVSCGSDTSQSTRGIGVYPGDPGEDFSPRLQADHDQYRNLALQRPAYHSSSYDYNLTAQLVTDGIGTKAVPAHISMKTHLGAVQKNEREWVLDHVTGSGLTLEGNDIYIEFGMEGNFRIPEITSIVINGSMSYEEDKQQGWKFTVSGSMNGIEWQELDSKKGPGLPGFSRQNMFMRPPADTAAPVFDFFADFMGPRDPNEPEPSFSFNFAPRPATKNLAETFEFESPVSYRVYRVSMNSPSALSWTIGDFDFFHGENQVEVTPSHQFNSAWMSAGSIDEWVYVDLGSTSSFDLIKLHWIQKATSGSIQVSDDGLNWTDLAILPEGDVLETEIQLETMAKGRYVRILMHESASKAFILSELEIMGTGGLVPIPKEIPEVQGNKMHLAGGDWKIERASEVSESGEAISQKEYDAEKWVVATVPGTALVSYWNAGALPDPNYSDNQLMISESFFNSDFWYRNEFDVPANFGSEKFFLDFDGINWKADIYLNGKQPVRWWSGRYRSIYQCSFP